MKDRLEVCYRCGLEKYTQPICGKCAVELAISAAIENLGQGWEKSFDEKFLYEENGYWKEWIDSYDENDNYVGKVLGWAVPESFKSFIRQHFPQRRVSEEKILNLFTGGSADETIREHFLDYAKVIKKSFEKGELFDE